MTAPAMPAHMGYGSAREPQKFAHGRQVTHGETSVAGDIRLVAACKAGEPAPCNVGGLGFEFMRRSHGKEMRRKAAGTRAVDVIRGCTAGLDY